jgi:mannose-6-phosphate isomerase-like protein (cupin superfamily)
MSDKPGQPIHLSETYVHLRDGGGPAPLVSLTPEFWTEIGTRSELHRGRLVMVFTFTRDWSTWEVHPAADELVVLLAGSMDLVLEEADGGQRVIPLREPGSCVVVPQGAWHTANVPHVATALHITWGEGTENRPR